MGVTVTGATELKAKLAALKERLPGAAAAALYQKAQQIMTASDSIVPVEHGRLRASHYVELPKFSGTVVSLRMGYGASYALAVHERMGAHHEHGQAKFLELAFHEKASDLANWLAAQIKSNLKSGKSLGDSAFPTSPEDAEKQHRLRLAHRSARLAEKRAARRAAKGGG
jgi:hypothetical protein